MAVASAAFARSPAKLVAVVCAAQVLVQIGVFFWPTLLPGMIRLWTLRRGRTAGTEGRGTWKQCILVISVGEGTGDA